jgi:hypothetical protein
VFNPDKPVSMLFDASAAIDQGRCGGIGCGCGGLVGREPIYPTKSICAGETTLDHVMT